MSNSQALDQFLSNLSEYQGQQSLNNQAYDDILEKKKELGDVLESSGTGILGIGGALLATSAGKGAISYIGSQLGLSESTSADLGSALSSALSGDTEGAIQTLTNTASNTLNTTAETSLSSSVPETTQALTSTLQDSSENVDELGGDLIESTNTSLSSGIIPAEQTAEQLGMAAGDTELSALSTTAPISETLAGGEALTGEIATVGSELAIGEGIGAAADATVVGAPIGAIIGIGTIVTAGLTALGIGLKDLLSHPHHDDPNVSIPVFQQN